MKARITGDEEYGYNPRLRKLIIEVVENQMRSPLKISPQKQRNMV